MNSFEVAVKAALAGWPGNRVFLAAVSGGADSTAMLAALAAVRKEMGFSLRVLHVEHGIRSPEESRGDARAVIELCGDLKVSWRVISIPQGRIAQAASRSGLGIEAAARFFRRQAWNREAQRIGAAKILVAHTRDDLLETCLIGILRGAGPAGLAIMPRERGRILRPLLDLTHAEVLAYLKERGIPFRTDSSNQDTRFLRNRIRHILIPCLDHSFPSWRSALTGLAETQAKTAAFISAEARTRLPWNSGDSKGFWIDAGIFAAQPLVIREEAVFQAADALAAGVEGASVPRRRSLREFLAGLERGSPLAGDLGPLRIEVRDNKITAAKAGSRVFERSFSLLLEVPGLYTLPGRLGSLSVTVESPGPDARTPEGKNVFYASLPLVLRPWKAGDCIVKARQKRRLSDILKSEARAAYTAFITAQDRRGNAAFIGAGAQKEPLLLARDDDPGALAYRFSIGGTDVGRSE